MQLRSCLCLFQENTFLDRNESVPAIGELSRQRAELLQGFLLSPSFAFLPCPWSLYICASVLWCAHSRLLLSPPLIGLLEKSVKTCFASVNTSFSPPPGWENRVGFWWDLLILFHFYLIDQIILSADNILLSALSTWFCYFTSIILSISGQRIWN